MSTAMARQILAKLPIEMNDYLIETLEEGEACGY
jgi:hypothetical protein